ncbi:MAG: type II toxin-antitoxin system VapC family toxin [Capsulimonadaceae bacterium]
MARILLDTCAFGWYITDHALMIENVRDMIYQSDQILISPISLFELAIKQWDGEIWLEPPHTLEQVIDRSLKHYRVTVLPIDGRHLKRAASMEIVNDHRDPFDRLIIATAIDERIQVVTSDTQWPHYKGLQYVQCRVPDGTDKKRDRR